MQGHPGALLDEEEDQSVVLTVKAIDCHSVQVAFEVVGAGALALDANLITGYGPHSLSQGLTIWVEHCPVQEGSMAGASLSFKAQLFHLGDQLFHSCVF